MVGQDGDSGRVIVAGAAYGIDSAAHRGALARRHPTKAVHAPGTDVNQPVGNAELLRTIAENHLILSELHPDATQPEPSSSPAPASLPRSQRAPSSKPESDPGPCASPNKHENSDESWAPSPEP